LTGFLLESDLDIRRLLEFVKTFDPEEVRNNPSLAILLNYEIEDSPNIELTSLLKQRFDQYAKRLSKLPLSADTRRSYESRVNGFISWLATAGEDYSQFFKSADCRSAAVSRYKQYLRDEKHAPPNTVNAFLVTMDHFCSFLGLEQPKIKREFTPHHKLKTLCSEEQASVLAAADGSKPLPRALLYLLLHTDLRISECYALNADDVMCDKGQLTVKGPKGALDRQISVDSAICDVIQHWLDARALKFLGRDAEPALFVNPQGKRMSEVAMRKIVRKVGERAGLGDNIYPDLLRQTFIANKLTLEREGRECARADRRQRRQIAAGLQQDV
jgi:site-specific recombinase XerD